MAEGQTLAISAYDDIFGKVASGQDVLAKPVRCFLGLNQLKAGSWANIGLRTLVLHSDVSSTYLTMAIKE
jgi:hypothetical protein